MKSFHRATLALGFLICSHISNVAFAAKVETDGNCPTYLFPQLPERKSALTEFPDGAVDLSHYRAPPALIAKYRAGLKHFDGYEKLGFPVDYAKFFGTLPNTSGITAEEMQILREYKLGAKAGGIFQGNYAWNRALGSGTPRRIGEFETEIKVLSSGLNKLPAFTGFVTRSMSLPDDIASKYVAGEIIYETVFVSTSKHGGRDMSDSTDTIFYRIELRGRGGHDIDFDHDAEAEVLISPNIPFHVTSVEKRTITSRMGAQRIVTYISLTEILPAELHPEGKYFERARIPPVSAEVKIKVAAPVLPSTLAGHAGMPQPLYQNEEVGFYFYPDGHLRSIRSGREGTYVMEPEGVRVTLPNEKGFLLRFGSGDHLIDQTGADLSPQ